MTVKVNTILMSTKRIIINDYVVLMVHGYKLQQSISWKIFKYKFFKQKEIEV